MTLAKKRLYQLFRNPLKNKFDYEEYVEDLYYNDDIDYDEYLELKNMIENQIVYEKNINTIKLVN